ncbi:hypothetical protein TNCV_4096661 [Trichonephila clavipes]|nr:hypothetical protein TNCV_4096661 [Trichonephila clavipes]
MSQVRDSNRRLSKVDSAFHSFSGSMNEYQVTFGTEHWMFPHQIEHLTETSAHAPNASGHVKSNRHNRLWSSWAVVPLSSD